MSIKAIQKALKQRISDEFQDGDVIRWKMQEQAPIVWVPRSISGSVTIRQTDGPPTYAYAAIKTPVGWVTTSWARGGKWDARLKIGPRLSFEELLEVFRDKDCSEIEFASAWEKVS